MKQKIWLLTWDDGSDSVCFEKLEDARDYALSRARMALDEDEEYQDFVEELNNSYDEYRGFFVEGWFWCNAIEFYR